MVRQEGLLRFPSIVVLSTICGLFWSASAFAAITTINSVSPAHDSSDPWNIGGTLTVGLTGDGGLTITGGSRVVDTDANVAAIIGSTASVTVSDVNSTWENSGVLSIGEYGDGTLTISNGGTVTAEGGALIGYTSADGWGSVTVTDANSLLQVGGGDYGLRIGGSGAGELLISAGARVEAEYVRVTSATTEDSQLTVSGADSLLQVADYLVIGSGGRMDVNDGGQVTDNQGSVSGTVRIDGHGSLWTNSSGLGIYSDTEVTVSGGGKIVSGNSGMQPSSGHASSVTVTGEGSLWEIQGTLGIGVTGNSSLLISDGAEVTSEGATVKAYVDDSAVVTVTGPNSVWVNTGSLTVGGTATRTWLGPFPATYGTIIVTDGATVETDNMVVWYDSILAGNGTFAASQLTNHGIIRPGNSIGTLMVDGDLTMDSNSVLEAEIDDSGDGDLLSVTGDVEILAGTVKAISTETITATQQYTIVEANAVSGTFDALDISSLDMSGQVTIAELGYEPNAVVLNVVSTTFDGTTIPLTGNQREVGSVLRSMADEGGNAITSAVDDLHSYADLRNAYSQLSGQTRAPLNSVATAGVDRQMAIVSDRLHRAAGTFGSDSGLFGGSGAATLAMGNPALGVETASDFGMASSPLLFALGNGTPYMSDQSWGVWGRGYGVHGRRDTAGDIPGYTHTTYGSIFGLDFQLTDQILVGVLGGLSKGDVDHARSRDSADITTNYYGLYGSYETPQWYVDSIFSYGDLGFETRRYVDIVDERLDGDFDGSAIGAYVEGGFAYHLNPQWLLQPLAGFQFTRVETDGYTESAGAGSLAFGDEKLESYKSALGVREIGLLYKGADGAQATVEFRGRWLHEFGDRNSTVCTRFVSDPDLAFSVTDARAPRDSVQLGVGFDVWFGKALRTFVDYDWEGNKETAVQLVSAGLQYRW